MIIDKTVFRQTGPADASKIADVHTRAFGRPTEGELAVKLLADETTETLDLAAEVDGDLIGHVALSAVKGPDKALALGPVGVDPKWRDFQIGTELVRRAISLAKDSGWKSIFVLGDPVFYGRFGFRSDIGDRVSCAYQCANFLGLELEEGALAENGTTLEYPKPFHDVD